MLQHCCKYACAETISRYTRDEWRGGGGTVETSRFIFDEFCCGGIGFAGKIMCNDDARFSTIVWEPSDLDIVYKQDINTFKYSRKARVSCQRLRNTAVRSYFGVYFDTRPVLLKYILRISRGSDQRLSLNSLA